VAEDLYKVGCLLLQCLIRKICEFSVVVMWMMRVVWRGLVGFLLCCFV